MRDLVVALTVTDLVLAALAVLEHTLPQGDRLAAPAVILALAVLLAVLLALAVAVAIAVATAVAIAVAVAVALLVTAVRNCGLVDDLLRHRVHEVLRVLMTHATCAKCKAGVGRPARTEEPTCESGRGCSWG